MSILGILLLVAVFVMLFCLMARNMGVKDSAMVFGIAIVFTTLIELALWLIAH